MSRKRIFLAIVVIAAIGCAVGGYLIDRTTRNAYAVWWVADMVVEHLRANEQEWPRSWEDLQDDYETCVSRSGQPWTFEQLRSRVTVDFNADVEKLRASAKEDSEPDFRVIWLSDGRDDHLGRREPNTIIFDYLRDFSPEKPVMTGQGGSAK